MSVSFALCVVISQDVYAEKLLRKVPEVEKQSRAAMFMVKRVKKFFVNMAQIHTKFAADVVKVGHEEKKKVMSMAVPDKMNSCRDAFMWVLNDTSELAQIHKDFSEEVPTMPLFLSRSLRSFSVVIVIVFGFSADRGACQHAHRTVFHHWQRRSERSRHCREGLHRFRLRFEAVFFRWYFRCDLSTSVS
jgi:hypothetical protein